MRAVLALCVLLTLADPGTARQDGEERKAWNVPFQPFRVVGNVHFVGATGVSAFLIVTPAGSILLDGGLPETAPQIARNIAALGFRLADVKYLLNSHAHFDHAGGLAELKRLTGASMVASGPDAPTLRAGGGADMPPVTVDRAVADGETVSLGDTTLIARVTSGHTRGCTTWTTTAIEQGRPYRVVFYCSTSVVDRLVDNAGYPEIAADYERTFEKLRTMQADVFLAAHPFLFTMEAKVKNMKPGASNPFVDPAEFRRFVDGSEREFRAALKKQQPQR